MTAKQIIGALIAVLIAGCFLPLGESLHSGFWSALSDGLHVPLFFSLVLLADRLYRDSVPGLAPRLAGLFIGSAAAATAIEILQPLFGRSESWVDLQNGLLGTLLALLLIYTSGKSGGAGAAVRPAYRGSRASYLLFMILAVAGTGYAFAPSVRFFQLEQLQARRFPLLAGLGNELELLAWEPYGGASTSLSAGEIKIEFGSSGFSGAEFVPARVSWRGFSSARIKVFISKPLRLWIRIDDDGKCEDFGDRFEKGFELPAGPAEISIPIDDIENSPGGRKLNLDSIKRVLFFTDSRSSPSGGTGSGRPSLNGPAEGGSPVLVIGSIKLEK